MHIIGEQSEVVYQVWFPTAVFHQMEAVRNLSKEWLLYIIDSYQKKLSSQL